MAKLRRSMCGDTFPSPARAPSTCTRFPMARGLIPPAITLPPLFTGRKSGPSSVPRTAIQADTAAAHPFAPR